MNSLRLPVLSLLTFAAAACLATAKPVEIVPDSLEVKVDVKANVDSFTATVAGGELAVSVYPETSAIASAVYKFNWKGVKTGKEKRDHEMLEWADSEEHPEGSFTLKSIDTRSDASIAIGTLEFHGVSRDIEFPVEVSRTETGFAVSGVATIDHREWGLKQFRKFLVLTVRPNVTVRFKFETRNPA